VGNALPPQVKTEQRYMLAAQLVGDRVQDVTKAMQGLAMGFMFFASYQPLQRGNHLRKMNLNMLETYDYENTEAYIMPGEMEVLVVTMAFTETTDGHSVDPVPLARHKDPMQCSVGWLSMFLFMRWFVDRSHKEVDEEGNMKEVKGRGIPNMLAGPQAYYNYKVSRVILLLSCQCGCVTFS
jgi:hypothetical protein